MTAGSEFRRLLSDGAARSSVDVPEAAVGPLETYFDLLQRWNRKINLTALPLDPPTPQTIDRLILEPLVAAQLVDDVEVEWFDLGSGGGSPAIPLRIVRLLAHLTMVESRSRKAAFLREVGRELGWTNVSVEAVRFESLAGARDGKAGLVTARAVRGDEKLFRCAEDLLRDGGMFCWFHSEASSGQTPSGFRLDRTISTPGGELTVLRRVPRGT